MSTVDTCSSWLARSISFVVRLCLLLCCICLHNHRLAFHLDHRKWIPRVRFILGHFVNMGIVSSFFEAVLKLFSGSEDSPQRPPFQPPPPQVPLPQQPYKPHRPHRPQEARPPQSYPPSTSPPKQHKPHSPRPSKYQPVRP